MATEHCRDIQNYIATKNARKHGKECHDIKHDFHDKIESRRLNLCRDNYTYDRYKSRLEFNTSHENFFTTNSLMSQ